MDYYCDTVCEIQNEDHNGASVVLKKYLASCIFLLIFVIIDLIIFNNDWKYEFPIYFVVTLIIGFMCNLACIIILENYLAKPDYEKYILRKPQRGLTYLATALKFNKTIYLNQLDTIFLGTFNCSVVIIHMLSCYFTSLEKLAVLLYFIINILFVSNVIYMHFYCIALKKTFDMNMHLL
jgi:hypothetical protein